MYYSRWASGLSFSREWKKNLINFSKKIRSSIFLPSTTQRTMTMRHSKKSTGQKWSYRVGRVNEVFIYRSLPTTIFFESSSSIVTMNRWPDWTPSLLLINMCALRFHCYLQHLWAFKRETAAGGSSQWNRRRALSPASELIRSFITSRLMCASTFINYWLRLWDV